MQIPGGKGKVGEGTGVKRRPGVCDRLLEWNYHSYAIVLDLGTFVGGWSCSTSTRGALLEKKTT